MGWSLLESADDHADIVRSAALVAELDKDLGCLCRRIGPRHAGYFLIVHHAVQTVTAQQHHVTGAQIDRPTRIDIYFAFVANAARDDVAVPAGTCLLGRERPAANLLFDP